MSFATMTLVLQFFAAVFAQFAVFSMRAKRPPALLTRIAPGVILALAFGLAAFAVALRDGWIDVPH